MSSSTKIVVIPMKRLIMAGVAIVAVVLLIIIIALSLNILSIEFNKSLDNKKNETNEKNSITNLNFNPHFIKIIGITYTIIDMIKQFLAFLQ